MHRQASNGNSPVLQDSLPQWSLGELLQLSGLSELELPELEGALKETVVSSLCIDSRACDPGALFLCLVEEDKQQQAEEYIQQALSQGAAAVLVSFESCAKDHVVICWPGLRKHWSALIARYFYDPSQGMQIAAITGTNGKTSCAWCLSQVVAQLSQRCGLIGTLGLGIQEREQENNAPEKIAPEKVVWKDVQKNHHTTPDNLTVQQALFKWHNTRPSAARVNCVAVEASSHGIVQGRLDGIEIDVAVFTNLTRDHLDYHQSFEQYEAAKTRLFHWPSLKGCVLNLQDPVGLRIWQSLSEPVRDQVTAYRLVGTQGEASQPFEPLQALRSITGMMTSQTSAGMQLQVQMVEGTQSMTGEVWLPYCGAYNAANALAVIGAALALGFNFDQVMSVVSHVDLPPGRLQRIENTLDAEIWVDYAHTPDALQQALQACRALNPKKLTVIFGCGGERDKGKRSQMGAVATAAADCVILTNDNPRSESPERIIEEVMSGIVHGYQGDIFQITDREKAIQKGVDLLMPGEALLVAGKGHEDTQVLANISLKFNDVMMIEKALQNQIQQI